MQCFPLVCRQRSQSTSRYDFLRYMACHHESTVTMVITRLILYRWWLCSMMSEPCRETNSEKTEKQNQPQFTDSHLSTIASLLALRSLKQQLQDWKLTIQSEHSVLEDKYSGMEVTMETLRKHNVCLQDMLTQVNSLSLLNTADHTTLVFTIINTHKGTGEVVSRCLSSPFIFSSLITVMWLSVFSLFGISDQV